MESALLLKTVVSFVVAGVWIGGFTLLAERLGSKKGGLLGNLPSTILIALVLYFTKKIYNSIQRKKDTHQFDR